VAARSKDRTAAARLLRLWVRSLRRFSVVTAVCCQVKVSLAAVAVVVCDLETSRKWRPWITLGCSARGKKEGL